MTTCIRCLILAFGLASLTSAARAGTREKLEASDDEFTQTISDNFSRLTPQNFEGKQLPLNKPIYLPIANLIGGQDEYSVENVLFKLDQNRDSYNLRWDDKKKLWERHEDGGRSILPPKEAIVVVRLKGGRFRIVDGHHHVFMSLFVAASTIPSVIMEDHSALSDLQSLQQLVARGGAFFERPLEDVIANPLSFPNMHKNPNRFFASLLAARIQASYGDGKISIDSKSVSKDSVWIKINQGIPFLEFYIARVLTNAGLKYDRAWKGNIPRKDVELARDALRQAKAEGKMPELEGVLIFNDRKEAGDADESDKVLKKLLDGFLTASGRGCGILNENISVMWNQMAVAQ